MLSWLQVISKHFCFGFSCVCCITYTWDNTKKYHKDNFWLKHIFWFTNRKNRNCFILHLIDIVPPNLHETWSRLNIVKIMDEFVKILQGQNLVDSRIICLSFKPFFLLFQNFVKMFQLCLLLLFNSYSWCSVAWKRYWYG